MNLHDRMGAEVADLPDLPDLLPEVERIHRRRSATRRAGLISLSTALVLGVGTLTIASPWAHPRSTSSTAVGSPTLSLQQFAENAARILQNTWPVHGVKVVWVRQFSGSEDTSQFTLFKLEEGSKTWQVHVILYGSSATTPYPLVTTLPSSCAMEPADCVSNADGTIHAYAPGAGLPVVYVFSGDDPLFNIGVNPYPTAPITPHAGTTPALGSAEETEPLTVEQFKQLAMSDGMRQIYAEGAQAGLLSGAFHSTATPIPSYTP